MPLTLIPLLLKLAPVILGIIETLVQTAHDNKLLAAGQAQAIAEGVKRISVQLAIARAAEDNAEKKHQQDPTDTAFDPDFKRKD